MVNRNKNELGILSSISVRCALGNKIISKRLCESSSISVFWKPTWTSIYRVGLKGLQGFEFSHYGVAKGEKPSPIYLSAILGKIN